MKRIYLVRHGEVTSNLKRTWRTANEPLTDNGKKQAMVLAKRVKQLPIKHIVYSTALRTAETAEIIADQTGLPHEGNELFYAEKTPTSIQGLVHEKQTGNQVEEYIKASLENAEDPDYRFENEENLWERRERVKNIFAWFDTHKDDELLIVTHGNIMKMIAAYIILGSDCSAKNLHLASERLKTSNGGITQLIYEGNTWRVLIWNDHAHFAE